MLKTLIATIFVVALVVIFTDDEPKYDLSQATEYTPSLALDRDAKKFATAMNNRDFETTTSLTHPEIVKSIGGHEAVVEATKKLFSKSVSAAILDMSFESNNEIITINNSLVAIVPYKVQMIQGDQRFYMKSFYLALSSLQGQNWHFVDGIGFQKDNGANAETILNLLIPGYAGELVIPEKTLPVKI